MASPVPLESNFLVPNATFIAELFAFAIIVFLLSKYVIPPINKAMAARQDAIRAQFAELDQAKADAKSTEEEYKKQLEKELEHRYDGEVMGVYFTEFVTQ